MTDRSVIAYPAILHFSESRHYIREVSPANTMAYDMGRAPRAQWKKERSKGERGVEICPSVMLQKGISLG